MIRLLKQLDDVLRQHHSETCTLIKGTDGVRIRLLVSLAIVLGVTYGLFMGLYAVLTRTPPCFSQLFVTAAKVPALFVLTLLVTFPSLYVFSALLGVRLSFRDTFRMIMVAIVINLAVLASLGPITGFFTLSTTSYHFMKLLNFAFFAISGIIGLNVLLRILSRLEGLNAPKDLADFTPSRESKADQYGDDIFKALKRQRRSTTSPVSRVFQVWVVIYALVGAQMGWVLRPFIGSPDIPFQWFRERQANIFLDIAHTVANLLGGR